MMRLVNEARVNEKNGFSAAFPGYYQTAYVTNDLEQAKLRAGVTYGIREWLTTEFSFPVKPSGDVTVGVALANVGASQIELIQPTSGATAIYRDILPDGAGFHMALHHLCKGFDTKEQFLGKLADLKRQGVQLPIDISDQPGGGIALACYADFRQTLGHYLEFVWFNDVGWEWLDTIPCND
jgi:hypothetical protein